jgi:ankyrin repeat protein
VSEVLGIYIFQNNNAPSLSCCFPVLNSARKPRRLLVYTSSIIATGSWITIDTEGLYSRNTLHCAAYNGHLPVVMLLLDRDAAIDGKNRISVTALQIEERYQYNDTVSLLIECGAVVGTTDSS